MYDIRSAMLNIGIVFTPGKFKINLEKTWKTPGILVNLRSTDPVIISSPKVLFSCQDVGNVYSNEPNCTVSKIFLNQDIPVVCQQQK